MGIKVIIPVPTSAASVNVKTKSGKAKYKAGANLVKWKMRTFAGILFYKHQLSSLVAHF